MDCIVSSLPNKLVDYANHCFKFNSTILPKHDKCSLASLSLFFNLPLSQLQEMTLTHKIVMLTKQTEGLILSLRFFTRSPCFLDWIQIPGSHVQGHLPVCQHLLQAIYSRQNISVNVRHQLLARPEDVISAKKKTFRRNNGGSRL